MSDHEKYIDGMKRHLANLQAQLSLEMSNNPMGDHSSLINKIQNQKNLIDELINFANPEKAAEMKSVEIFNAPKAALEFKAKQKQINFHKRQAGAMQMLEKSVAGLKASGIVTGGTTAAGVGTGAAGTATGVSSGMIGGCVGIAIVAFLSCGCTDEEPPHPQVSKYQIYLVEWIVYAVNTLRKNGGNFDAVRPVKTFQQWQKNSAI